MKVYAIIVTYNGEQWIDKCLDSLYKSSFPVSIIVVDNASTDSTVSTTKEKYSEVHLVQCQKNLGFGQANNIGIRIALEQNADYVFLLNQDAWVKDDTISKLISVATKNPEYGIISPFHVNRDENKLERQFVDFLSSKYNEMIVSDIFFRQIQDIYETSYIHAAAWLLSRHCIKTVGGFDPIYFHYGEDDDYLMRTRYFSLKVGLVPSALIVHDGVYKTWGNVEWNESRNRVMELQQLKKMNPHFKTNVLAYFKRCFDELTTLLLFRKFKKFMFRLRIIWSIIMEIKPIYASYKASFNKGEFLEQ